MTAPTINRRGRQTPVRDQGDRPACVGFAVSAAHEWMAGDGLLRSAEDGLWAGHQVGGPAHCEATAVQFVLLGLARHGHASETAWPYGNPRWLAERPPAALDPANRRHLPAWRTLPGVSLPVIAAALIRGAAVVLTIRVVRAAWLRGDGFIDAEPGRKTPGLGVTLFSRSASPRVTAVSRDV